MARQSARWDPARWPGRPTRSTASASRRAWVSRAPAPTAWTPSAIATHVAECLFALALLGTHLSRVAEDLIIYANPALGFVRLDERYSTGSSLMPQKRNPDPLELARGKAGRLIGHLTGFLATLKGLPSGYNKDLQEDKEPLFDAFDTLALTARRDRGRPHAGTQPGPHAGRAERGDAGDRYGRLPRQKGIPFREAHHIVGRAVSQAAGQGVSLADLPLESLNTLSPVFAEDVAAVFDFDESVRRRKAMGGTAPDALRAQIAAARAWLEEFGAA